MAKQLKPHPHSTVDIAQIIISLRKWGDSIIDLNDENLRVACDGGKITALTNFTPILYRGFQRLVPPLLPDEESKLCARGDTRR
jgi:hypothetical protein